MIGRFFINRKANKMARSIHKAFLDEENFDTKIYDLQIKTMADYVHKKLNILFTKKSDLNSNSIAVLATSLYDVGGHTTCFINFIRSFHKTYRIHCFLTRKEGTLNRCKKRIVLLNDITNIKGINATRKKIATNIIDLYNQIAESKCKLLFLFIHPNDIVSTAVISLLKKNTDIKILFFNHADHLPVLSLAFVDLILDFRPAGQNVTKYKRGYDNTTIVPLQSSAISETIYYSSEILNRKKEALGIHKDEYFTLSGFASKKIFQKGRSEYIKMVKDLLLAEPRLKHVLVTDLTISQKKVIDSVFQDVPEIYPRFIIIPRTPNFDILFQACDLFIDSFPIGSALTHIDMMRNKKPTIVKTNKHNPLYSFEYYLPKNYEYAFESLDEMKTGILSLLHDKKKQDKIISELYKHYLENYELTTSKLKYQSIIKKLITPYQNKGC